jgi:hypothetical protein
MTRGRWAELEGVALMTAGKDLVTERLEGLGCTVTRSSNPIDGKLGVRTSGGRSLEVFVSTQRLGGYAFWTKRRLQPSRHRLAALVLLGDDPQPELYIVPSYDWLRAEPPLTDRDYEGRASDPEYGIDLGPASLPSLRRYAWTDTTAKHCFR